MKCFIVFSLICVAFVFSNEQGRRTKLLENVNACKENIYLERIHEESTFIYSKCKLYDGEELPLCPELTVENYALRINCKVVLQTPGAKDNCFSMHTIIGVNQNYHICHSKKDYGEYLSSIEVKLLETTIIDNLRVLEHYVIKKN